MEPISCPYCCKELFDKNNLLEHFRIDHKDLMSLWNKVEGEKNGEKKMVTTFPRAD